MKSMPGASRWREHALSTAAAEVVQFGWTDKTRVRLEKYVRAYFGIHPMPYDLYWYEIHGCLQQIPRTSTKSSITLGEKWGTGLLRGV